MIPSRPNARWLGLIVGLQALTLMAVWGLTPAVPVAQAQGAVDAGAQREQILGQLKAIDGKLDRLITLLSDGKLQVSVKK